MGDKKRKNYNQFKKEDIESIGGKRETKGEKRD